jgi:hypothetical protein
MYHYHVWSPCIGTPSIGDSPDACSSVTACNSNVVTYAESKYSTTKKPIGVTKDGAILWGPFDENGDLWDACDVDVCNGKVIDGYYGYVATTWFPYTVGCWGPGPIITNAAECTENGYSCSDSSSGTNSAVMNS